MTTGIPIPALLNEIKTDVVGWISDAIAAANVNGIVVNSVSTINTVETIYQVAQIDGQSIRPSTIIVNNVDSGSLVESGISFANNGDLLARWVFFEDTSNGTSAYLELSNSVLSAGLFDPFYIDAKNSILYITPPPAASNSGGAISITPGALTGITPYGAGLTAGSITITGSNYAQLNFYNNGSANTANGDLIVYASGSNLFIKSGATYTAKIGTVNVLPGSFALTADISPSQITSNQNDYAPTSFSTSAVLRLTSDASRNITGLAGGSDGAIYIIANVGSNNIVLIDESASSSAANRFALDGDLTLGADTSAIIYYDSTSSRWRLLSVGKTTGGSSFTAASTTEVLTGTDTTKGVTPDALAALWEQGSDVASAATISLGEGGYFNITGTTTITDIDLATDKAGRVVVLKFAGALTLTHNASTLILPTGANITTAAGDIAAFVSEGSDVVRCIYYSRASGAGLISAPYDAQYVTLATNATLTNERVLTAGANITLTDAGAGSTITIAANTKHIATLSPLANEPPSSAYATPDTRNGHPTLDFDGATDEEAVFGLILPAWYAGGGITVDTYWSFTSATSGSLRVQISIERMDASSLDIDADSFATANSAGGTAPGTSGQLIKVSIAFTSGSQMDSAAAGEMIRVKVRRDADGTSGTDDITTDAELLCLVVRET